MTAAQPKLIDDAGDQVIKAKGLAVPHRCAGQYVGGTIGLSQPNPFGRSHCHINFTSRTVWQEANPAIVRQMVALVQQRQEQQQQNRGKVEQAQLDRFHD